jgi:hypothetical protein
MLEVNKIARCQPCGYCELWWPKTAEVTDPQQSQMYFWAQQSASQFLAQVKAKHTGKKVIYEMKNFKELD